MAYNTPAEVRTETAVPGCHWRPMKSEEETTEIGTIVTELWKATCPPVEAVLETTSRDEVKIDGVTYHVVGTPRTYPDHRGRPFKVTVLAQRITP